MYSIAKPIYKKGDKNQNDSLQACLITDYIIKKLLKEWCLIE
jgi:hypothetical protein